MPRIPLRRSKLSLTINFICAMAFVLQGYDLTIVNGLLELNTWESQFPTIKTTANKSEKTLILQGTTAALFEVRCAVRALSCFFTGDWLGAAGLSLLPPALSSLALFCRRLPLAWASLSPAESSLVLGLEPLRRPYQCGWPRLLRLTIAESLLCCKGY